MFFIRQFGGGEGNKQSILTPLGQAPAGHESHPARLADAYPGEKRPKKASPR